MLTPPPTFSSSPCTLPSSHSHNTTCSHRGLFSSTEHCDICKLLPLCSGIIFEQADLCHHEEGALQVLWRSLGSYGNSSWRTASVQLPVEGSITCADVIAGSDATLRVLAISTEEPGTVQVMRVSGDPTTGEVVILLLKESAPPHSGGHRLL